MAEQPQSQQITAEPGQPITIQCVAPPAKRGGFGRFMHRLFVGLFLFSIVVNVYLVVLLSAGLGREFRTTVLRKGQKDKIIAVYDISGAIDDETAAKFDRFCRMVRDSDEIKAVVIRVNSPGGTVNASQRIYDRVGQIRSEMSKPVAVSMGAVAASGGYYISAPAERIFADSSTITGSIGVIGMFPVVNDALEKLGIDVLTIRSRQATRWKAKPSGWEPVEPSTLADIQDLLDEHHRQFVQAVLAYRDERIEERERQVEITTAAGETETITEVAPFQGKVYLAGAAKEIGLIDEVGSLDDAVAWMTNKLGGEAAQVVHYQAPSPGLVSLLLGGASALEPTKVLDNLSAPRILYEWRIAPGN